ncbi:type II secretion system F family protein [Thioalkalivibrio thiocyanodenitrificans]|uniref:type II secretion system F family protein n=1 Tax=Thioalkalivibrio thiocyanodenitrificans TaxID=243063 RepID=UPI000368CEBC|nr:type II secretion system F family protein [Thioalkalivibrio thiocyanodenitrificans]
MPLYRYKAATPTGDTSEGEIFAADEQQVINQLQAAGQIPIRVVQGGGVTRLRRVGVRARDVQVFTQELATLLGAGLPLDKSLQIIVDLSEDPRLARMTGRVLEQVRGGASLSEALEAQSGVFSRFYVSMVRAGEMGGAMEVVLQRLSEYLERAKDLRDSIVSALIYPAILLVVSLVSVFVLMVFVVPHFTQLFDDAGRALPMLTQVVVGSAELLRGYWWALIGAVVLIVLLLRHRLGDPAFRLRWDAGVLRLPLAGDLVRKLETARFSRTLGTLLGNGVPLLTAMSIVRETLNNRVLERGMGVAVEGLKGGQGMSAPLMEADLFPKLGMQMIRVGEETGRLEGMLMQVADIYDREVRVAVQRMLSLLEPVLIVGLGLLIATIIVSILIAIVSVNELAF